MKIAPLFVLISISLSSFGQAIYFPHRNYTDSASLAGSIPALAKKVIQFYKNANKINYWDDIFRYQIVANDYLSAKSSIDSLRKNYTTEGAEAVVRGIQYESYLLTKELQKKDTRDFSKLYIITLNDLYRKLSDKSKILSQNYFTTDIEVFKGDLKKIVTKLQDQNSDSIKIEDARKLCRAYNGLNVYSQIGMLADQFFIDEDNKKYSIEDSILIPTKDGSQLSALMGRLRNITTPQPVILMYDIYAAGQRDRITVKKIASHGYIGMVVNTRGKYLSPQKIEPFEHDASDAYDMIDWISKQPWCNGKIGMYGGSYLGFSQWSAVKKMHPALKTIVPQVAVGIGVDYPLTNNVFMSYMLRWIHNVTNNKLTDNDEFFDEERWSNLYERWYASGKSFRSLDSLDGRPNEIFQRWINHPAYDTFWQNMVPYKKEFSKIDIPILTTTGYFDDDQRGAFYYFTQHHKYNKKANHYMLIGPYDHYGAQSAALPYISGYTIDSVANININETVYLWFDHILKNGPLPPLLKDKINYQVMGSNTWKHAPSLRKINNDTLTFYLSSIRIKNNYQLQNKKPLTHESITQEISYTDRSDAHKSLPELVVIDSTINVGEGLTFITEAFKKPFEINGSFTGEIKFTMNKKDIDLIVELYELQANGKYFKLSSYLTRASYAKDRSKRQLLQPDKEEIVPINNSFFVSKRIEKGSQIIVLIGMNKKRDWQINYGTGKDVSDETIKDGVEPLRIQWSNESNIRLPVYR